MGLSSRLTLETIDYYTIRSTRGRVGLPEYPESPSGERRQPHTLLRNASRTAAAGIISALIRASERSSPLKLETRRRIRRLQEEAHIQVFVMPDSEHCADTAMAALAMAAESSKVTTDVIDVGTFPNLIDLHKIAACP